GSTGKHSADWAIPAFPGAANTSVAVADRNSAQTSACSRPPLPTTRNLMLLRSLPASRDTQLAAVRSLASFLRSLRSLRSPRAPDRASSGQDDGLRAVGADRREGDRHAGALLDE